MRPIHLAQLDKVRPVVVLTRSIVRPHMPSVTVAPITTRIRGLSTEVPVGTANGLDANSVISCDNITTIPTADLGREVGFLLSSQEPELANAINVAFDLE